MSEPVFVARERELQRLQQFLDRALTGQGQVAFITGEAGSGKTALITEFTRRAQERYADLIVAFGDCNAQTGIGDPYLPFREILSLLTGDVEAPLAQGAITSENASRLRKFLRVSGQVLVDLGPDLIDLFVPGAGIASRAAAFLAGKVGWLERLEKLMGHKAVEEDAGLEQTHMFEQYTNVVQAMAAEQPLMLIVDDLHWADAASISLLFHLGRRIQSGGEPHPGARILLVGAYRPDEVALGRDGERHPLEKVVAEFKRYFGDVIVDLDRAAKAEGRAFVDAFLDTEPNRLGEAFRNALYRHTGGHPLFTVELLREMQARGDLVQDEEGCWVEGPHLDWAALPARVEGVIQERIGRLDEELQEWLAVAAVEGEEFTAQVIATVQGVDERKLLRRLAGELDRKHRLIEEQGMERIGRQRLFRYRFSHELFQTYVYDQLSPVERMLLHGDVGEALEALYGERADEIAPQLARHFLEAGMEDKAVTYLMAAGDAARRMYANEEAVDYYERLLSPEFAEELTPSQRSEVMRKLGEVWQLMGRWADAERMYREALSLAEEVGDQRAQAAGQTALGSLLNLKGAYAEALAVLEGARSTWEAIGEREGVSRALGHIGLVHWHRGEYAQALACFEQQVQLATEIGDELGVSKALGRMGLVYWHQGDHARALEHFQQRLETARALDDRRGVSEALGNMGLVHWQQGDYRQALDCYEKWVQIAVEIGDRRLVGVAIGNMGILYWQQGDYQRALVCYTQLLQIATELGDPLSIAVAVGNMADAYSAQGRYDEAEALYPRAIALCRALNIPYYLCEYLYTNAQMYARQERYKEAQPLVEEALTVAEQLGDQETRFKAHLLSIRLQVALGQMDRAAALAQLEEMCDVYTREEERAALHFELWRLDEEREADGRAAAELYRNLYARTPNVAYRQRYETLTGQPLPDPPPLPELPDIVTRTPVDLEALLAQVDQILAERSVRA